VAYFITIVDFTIVNVALPTIGRQLHFSESDLQWVVTAYGLTFAGFLLLGGRAADLLGRSRLLMAGLVVFTGASLGGGLAASATFLVVMRGIQGVGAALVLPAALSIVMSMFSEGPERNKALGIWGGVGALGGTVGLLAGGILTTYVGWQYIFFFFSVPIGAAALILVPKVVPESRAGSARRSYDPFGAVSITGAVLVFIYAVSEAPQVGWATTQTVVTLAAGAVLLAAFFVIETKVDAPLLPLRLRGVAGSNAVGFLLGTSFFTFVFLGTLYMQHVLGFSALAAGAGWMTASVTSLAFAGLSHRLVTRTSPKAVMAFGMTLIGAGMLWATQAPPDGNFWADLAGPFFVAGIGTAFAFIPISIGALHRDHRTRRRSRRRPAQHLPEPRGCDWRGRRLVHGRLALPHPRAPRLPNRCGAHRRTPSGYRGLRARRSGRGAPRLRCDAPPSDGPSRRHSGSRRKGRRRWPLKPSPRRSCTGTLPGWRPRHRWVV